MLSGLSPQRRRLVVVLIAVVGAAVVAVGVKAAWPTSEPPTAAPAKQDKPGPVLIIPGYGGSLSSIDDLATTIRASGRQAVRVALPGQGTGDFHKQADALDADIDSALARCSCASVDLVGYSAGGVVARFWVADNPDRAGLVRRVVTIGSPHHGTEVAGLASTLTPAECPAACDELVPDSTFLRSLNAGDETPDGPQFVSIWSRTDDFVTPPDTAHLDGAVNVVVQAVCGGGPLSHSDLPHDARVLGLVLAETGVADAAPPTRSDCHP